MKNSASIFFTRSAGTILLVTAVAKLVSALGSAHILETPDPIFAISFRKVLLTAAGIEILVSFFCFFGKNRNVQFGLIAWLSTSFVVYRVGLMLVAYHKPCPCLGNLTDALRISPISADTVMESILSYLIIGSYSMLLGSWVRSHSMARL